MEGACFVMFVFCFIMKDQPNVESQMLLGISIVCVEFELEVGGEL